MIQRGEPEAVDPDERLGEAIEAYLALAEQGQTPDPQEFAARYPDIGDELREALDGLALVQGLVGEPSGPGHRLESGRRIACYRIVRELGHGGMGTVYEAVHVGLDRPVALKVLGHHAAPDSSGRRRFLNEARTAAGLHHTHIVPVYDVGQVGGLCYYAMQRIEGSGLDHVLRFLRRDRTTAAGLSQGGSTAHRALMREAAPAKSGDQTITWGDLLGAGGVMAQGLAAAGRDPDDEPSPFEPPVGSAYYRWIAEVGREAAEALAHAHQRGVVHRDVKPSNLLVDARGFVWVADFGLARRLADPSQTQHDSLLGTPRYMSPEQAGIGPIDGRSDIYSLGATLYELLTLRPPFEGQTAAELVEQITSREPAAPRQFDPRIPRDLETIVLKTLAKRQEDRYALATDLADDLGRFLSHEPVRARRISPLGRLWRFAQRHPSLAAVSTAAAAIVVTVATVAHVRVVHERNQAIAARNEAQTAMLKIEAANRKTREAKRTQLWREASVVRLSNVANRRVIGLGLLHDAAAMNPDPGLRGRLRDEAIEFLVLRDVERRPDFATGPARGLTFDPRGSRLVTLSEDSEELRLWDVATRRRLDTHRLRVGPVPPTPAPAPHRRRGGAPNPVAMVGPSVAVVLPEGLGLRFFDATTGAPLHDLKPSGHRLLSVLATPDGHRFVTVERSSDPVPGEPNSKVEFQVNLWDPGRIDRPVATLSRWESTAAAREMPLIAMAPDVSTVAVARSRKMSVALWSADDGRTLGTIETQTELTAVALGHAGLLATAGGGAVRLWDLEARTSLPGLDSHLSFVRTLRFNPKGTLLAVAGVGSGIEIWDVASHTVVAELPTPDRVEDLAFAPVGHLLAATAGASTAVWTVFDPLARVQLSGFEQPPTALAFRGDDLLAMGTRRGSIRFWSPGHCLSMAPQSDASPSDGLARDEPTALIFDGSDHLITLDAQALRVWPHPPAREGIYSVTRTEVPVGMWTMFPAPIARASGGRSLFMAWGARVLTWDPESPHHWSSLSLPPLARATHTGAVRGWEPPLAWRALAASPAGDRLYLLDPSGSVHALALEGTTARRLDWDLPIEATSLALSPDGATLALGDRLGSVALVDTTRGTIRSRLRPIAGESAGRVAALAFAPDGRTLAVGSLQGPVTLWVPDAPSAPLARLPGHRGLVITLAFAPEGRYLATGGADKLVNVWDLECLRRELGKLGLAW